MKEFVGLEKLSLVDFDGKMACTIFVEKCNFRCPFCHNKDLALASNTKEIPFSEIVNFLKKRINKLEGVCITGGEPTLLDTLEDRIRIIKEMGFLVKLDTNGYKPDVLKKLIDLKLIDYVAMDIKNSLEKYNLTTGCNNIDTSKIIESINILKTSGIDYEFRTTLVDEFHNKSDIFDIASLLKGAKKYYLQKYVSSEGCFNKNLHSIDKEIVEEYKEILKETIDHVELRGY